MAYVAHLKESMPVKGFFKLVNIWRFWQEYDVRLLTCGSLVKFTVS